MSTIGLVVPARFVFSIQPRYGAQPFLFLNPKLLRGAIEFVLYLMVGELLLIAPRDKYFRQIRRTPRKGAKTKTDQTFGKPQLVMRKYAKARIFCGQLLFDGRERARTRR